MNKLIKKILEEKILESKNDKSISSYILSFIEEKCEKCHEKNKELRYVISFLDGPKNYYFENLSNGKMKFKKFCNKCINSKSTSVKIYVEI